MNYVLFLADVFLLVLSSYFLLPNSKLKENTCDLLVARYVLLCAIVIGSSLVLSEFRAITTASYLIAHVLIFLIALAYYYKKNGFPGKNKALKDSYSFKRVVYSIFRNTEKPPEEISGKALAKIIFSQENSIITYFCIVVGIVLVVELIIAFVFIPNNWDSMTYHLSRVGYWAQFKSLRHFPTNIPRQNVYPINGEILLLWPYVFLKSDVGFGLLQFISMFFTSILVYKTSLLIKLSKKQSLLSACLYITLPLIILESTTTQNDIVATFFIFFAVYSLMSGFKTGSNDYILLSGISTGIAFGIKATFFLAAPGMIAGLIYYFRANSNEENKLRLIKWISYSLCFIALLGSYNYILNFIETKNVFGGHDAHAISQYSFDAFISNFTRIMYKFVDLTGIPNSLYPYSLAGKASEISKSLFALFDIKFNTSEATSPGIIFDFAINKRCNADLSYFGPLGFILILPAFFVNTVRMLSRKRINPFKAWLTMFSISILVSFCVLLKYNPWNGRFFIMFITFLMPFCGSFYRSERKISYRLKEILIACIITVVTFTTLKYNELKPLPWGALDSHLTMRCKISPNVYELLTYIRDKVGADKSIAVSSGGMWDFPLFNGVRKVFQIKDINNIPTGCDLVLSETNTNNRVFDEQILYQDEKWTLKKTQFREE